MVDIDGDVVDFCKDLAQVLRVVEKERRKGKEQEKEKRRSLSQYTPQRQDSIPALKLPELDPRRAEIL